MEVNMTKNIAMFLPLVIAGILQFGTSRSIAADVEKENSNYNKKTQYLKNVYFISNLIIAVIMIILDTMVDFADIDIFNLIGGKNTYNVVSLLSNITQTQNDYWEMFVFFFCMAMITPMLFFIAGHIEKNHKEAVSNSGLMSKQLFFDLINRVLMFSVGAFVAWLSLIILLRTPVNMLTESPFIKTMEYSLILLCLFINFRFQIMADREHETDPNTFGCVSICCSAIWCAFVYAVFSISFLLSFSTFLHINGFVVKEGIYLLMGIDCRIYLLLASIVYGMLFVVTSKGNFRNKYVYIFAYYIFSAGFLFLTPMLFTTDEPVLMVFAFITFFMFFWLVWRKAKKQMLEQKDESTINTKRRPDPWAIATFLTSVIIVLIAAVYPLVKSF